MIIPTIGRVVWYYPRGNVNEEQGVQPCPGIICFVHNERRVNLVAFNADGNQVPAHTITLVQDGDTYDNSKAFATWMPYQEAAAKKYPV